MDQVYHNYRQQQQQLVVYPSSNCTYKKKWSLLNGADELLLNIIDFLDGKSLIRIQRTCSIFFKLGNNDKYWYHLCRFEWGISPEYLCLTKSNTTQLSNKALYRAAYEAIKKLTRKMLEEQCLLSMQRRLSLPMSITKRLQAIVKEETNENHTYNR